MIFFRRVLHSANCPNTTRVSYITVDQSHQIQTAAVRKFSMFFHELSRTHPSVDSFPPSSNGGIKTNQAKTVHQCGWCCEKTSKLWHTLVQNHRTMEQQQRGSSLARLGLARVGYLSVSVSVRAGRCSRFSLSVENAIRPDVRISVGVVCTLLRKYSELVSRTRCFSGFSDSIPVCFWRENSGNFAAAAGLVIDSIEDASFRPSSRIFRECEGKHRKLSEFAGVVKIRGKWDENTGRLWRIEASCLRYSVGKEKIRLRTFLRISKMVIRLCLWLSSGKIRKSVGCFCAIIGWKSARSRSDLWRKLIQESEDFARKSRIDPQDRHSVD